MEENQQTQAAQSAPCEQTTQVTQPAPCEQPAQTAQPAQPVEYCPDTNLVWGILCTVMCCLPLGIVSIVKASSVEKLWNQGRKEEARKAAKSAKSFAIWGAVSGGIFCVLFFVLYVVLVVLASAANTMLP